MVTKRASPPKQAESPDGSLRLDKAVAQLQLAASRAKAQRLIEAGGILVNGQVVKSITTMVNLQRDAVTLVPNFEAQPNSGLRYVSRAGDKLDFGLKHFQLSVRGLSLLDAGASTGGFTDCLLQHGARRVLAVDVGHTQLHPSLREHSQVSALEKTDIRELMTENLPFLLDAAVCDVSFISVKKVAPAIIALLESSSTYIPWFLGLLKPQFEALDYATPHQRKRFDGVVRDAQWRKTIVKHTLADLRTLMGPHWQLIDFEPVPILGQDGNEETLMLWKCQGEPY